MKITVIKNKYKTGGYVNISFISKMETNDDDEEALDKKQIICSSYFKYDSKVLREGFEYKDIVI
jgi:hypothetical protein